VKWFFDSGRHGVQRFETFKLPGTPSRHRAGASTAVIQPRTPSNRIHLVFRVVVVAALVATLVQITFGGVVRATGSGLGCPDWPLCHGRIIPPFETDTLIEWSHRLAGSALGVLTIATAALAWVFYRRDFRIVATALIGLGLVLAAGGLGGAVVLTELVWWIRLIHLTIAEAVVACMIVVLVAGWRKSEANVGREPKVRETDRFNRLLLVALTGTMVLILSGSYMVGYGAGSSCATWPLCRGELFPDGTPYAIHMGHRLLVAIVGVIIVATGISAWLRRKHRPELGWIVAILLIVFAAQVMAGAGTVWSGFATQMKAMHLGLATLVWTALVFLAAMVYLPQRFDFRLLEFGSRRATKYERLTP